MYSALGRSIMPWTTLSYVGAFVLFVYFCRIGNVVFRCIYRIIMQKLKLNVKWSELGKWALITGGSDGIGKAYAEALARRGFDIILVSRTKEKLETVSKEIAEKYSVDTKIICTDFSGGPEVYETLKNAISDYEIGVLVNNVGMSYDHTEYFHAIPNGLDVIDKLIKSNIASCTMMTRIVLPRMEQRRKGVIINISSLTALYPMPLLNVYSASKAYVDYLSRTLHLEYKGKGVIVQSVLPGYVATKMSNRRISIEIPSAEAFVDSAIETVGLESYTFGYYAHKIRGFVHEWLRAHMPTWFNMAIAIYFMKRSRERYFKKQARKQE